MGKSFNSSFNFMFFHDPSRSELIRPDPTRTGGPTFVPASKGRFTRYDFVAYDKLTTGLRHELFRVNQTYNSLNGPKSCRRPVVSLSYATKSYRVNRP